MTWRLVIEKVATLEQVEQYYDLADVLDAHIALNFSIYASNMALPSKGSGGRKW